MSKQLRIFVGRERELSILEDLKLSRVASLVVLKGRRRIGKSRLAEEFSKSIKTYSFLGLAPQKGTSSEDQRKHFAVQFEQQVGLGGLKAEDWDDLLHHLALNTKSGRVLIVLDEINWMGSKDPSFLPKLKTAWDNFFSKNPELIMILSGSMSGWIDQNILSGTGFFGRITLDMTLEELSLNQCVQFWGKRSKQISTFEKFKILSVTGGVPRYLEMIRPDLSAEENIHRLCFRKEGILFNEFDRIFSDLFMRRAATYKEIVSSLVTGSATADELLQATGRGSSGVYSSYLDDLVKTGYLDRNYTWSIKTKTRSKLSRYRLKDNYLRFYLRYVEPRRESILRSGQVNVPGWSSIMGLQFENLVLNNRDLLYQALLLGPSEIEIDGPYFQSSSKSRPGCQVDLMIQTRFNTLYLCEIKFSSTEVGPSVIREVEEKIERLVLPRGFSVRPVLIHVNGVTDSVEDAEYFSSIIDMGHLVETSN